MKDLQTYLRYQNLRLRIVCVLLLILVLVLLTWMWFNAKIEGVNSEIEKLQKF